MHIKIDRYLLTIQWCTSGYLRVKSTTLHF